MPREDVEAVARLAEEHGAWILSDEIYSRLVYADGARFDAAKEKKAFSAFSVPGARADGAGGRLLEDVLHDRLAPGVGGDACAPGAESGAPRRAQLRVRRGVHAGSRRRRAHRAAGRSRGDVSGVPAPTRFRGGGAEQNRRGEVPRPARRVLRVSGRQRVREDVGGDRGRAAARPPASPCCRARTSGRTARARSGSATSARWRRSRRACGASRRTSTGSRNTKALASTSAAFVGVVAKARRVFGTTRDAVFLARARVRRTVRTVVPRSRDRARLARCDVDARGTRVCIVFSV